MCCDHPAGHSTPGDGLEALLSGQVGLGQGLVFGGRDQVDAEAEAREAFEVGGHAVVGDFGAGQEQLAFGDAKR